MTMNRREFVSWMSLGAVAASVVGCNNQTASQSSQNGENETQTGSSGGFQPVGTLEELEKQGNLANDMMGVLVVRGASGGLIALNRACPHQGCAVSPTEEGDGLVCPCHGSEFTQQGELVEGPANSGLSKYEVKTEDNQVLVKAG